MKIEQFTISSSASIIQAIEKINLNGMRSIIVINENGVVEGVATDGDIRRALLKKISLDENITKAMNREFLSLFEGEVLSDKEMLGIKIIPIINKETMSLSDILIKDQSEKTSSKTNTQVLIMAGGFGKRLRPLTNNIPKPMLEISGIPLLEITINYLRNLGLSDIMISTYYLPDKIKNYFGHGEKHEVNISYLDEKNPSGTAGCLSLIPENTKASNFLVINGDILTRLNYLELIESHANNNNDITIGTVLYEHVVPYGVLSSSKGRVNLIEEKPKITKEVSAGIYVIEKFVLDNYLEKGSYMDMPDLIKALINKNKKVATFPIHEYWLDIGKKYDFEKAQNDLGIYFGDQ